MAFQQKASTGFFIGAGVLVAAVLIGGAIFTKNPIAVTQPTPNPEPDSTTVTSDAPKVAIETEAGRMVLELYPKRAPKTVANFLKLIKAGFYDGTTFHRVEPDFVIQGGDPLSKDPATRSRAGTGGPGYTFEDEINPHSLGLTDEQVKANEERGYKYDLELESLPVTTGAVAMANSGPNTNGSQFFIVTGQDQPHLNGLHTVFGTTLEGLDVARRVTQGMVIKSVTILPE